MAKDKKDRLKIFTWLFLFAAIAFIIGVIALFAYKQALLDIVIKDADLSNSIYMRKVVRIVSAPYEFLGAGIAFGLISYLIWKRKRAEEWIEKTRAKYTNKQIAVIGAVLFAVLLMINLAIGLYFMNHVRIEGQDEGFHINNAKLVYEGKIPFI